MDTWGTHAEGDRDSQDSAHSSEDERGVPQPLGGDGPEPDSEPFSQADIAPTQPRSKARCDNIDLSDIPVEEFAVPPSAAVVPGLRSKEKPVTGASTRRKAKDSKAQNAREAEAPRTTAELDILAKNHYASSYALDVDELPVRMPKLPFASRLAVDSHEGSQLTGDGGYLQWLDYSPLPRPPKEGEENRSEDKQLRAATHPRVRSRELSKIRAQDVGADLYPMGFETRLPPFPQAIQIPGQTKNRHIEAIKQERALLSSVVHVAEISEEDDEDSWGQELTDSPRTITCAGTCRLDALAPLAGLSRSSSQQLPPQSAPSDVTMSGLSDFVSRVDDKVLSYILDETAKPKDKAPKRLAPGMPLPGQVPGFPLQL